MSFTQGAFYKGTPASLAFDTVGDGTGTVDAIADYSATPTPFKRVIPTGRKYAVTRLQIIIGDADNLTLLGYGGSVAALTNGLRLSGVIQGVAFTSGAGPFRSNVDWNAAATGTAVQQFVGNDRIFAVYQDLLEFGGPLYLDGTKGDLLQFIANDNFTFLNRHRFTIFGYFY